MAALLLRLALHPKERDPLISTAPFSTGWTVFETVAFIA
jgi:hypothetical protein